MQKLTFDEAKEVFKDMLNVNFDTVNICGHEYEQGTALQAVDPVAFRTALSDWIDSECQDGNLIILDD